MKVILGKKTKNKIITTKEFDKKFNRGESISAYLDLSKARRPGVKASRINVDLPQWAVVALDKVAKKSRTSRRDVIKTWLIQRLGTY